VEKEQNKHLKTKVFLLIKVEESETISYYSYVEIH